MAQSLNVDIQLIITKLHQVGQKSKPVTFFVRKY